MYDLNEFNAVAVDITSNNVIGLVSVDKHIDYIDFLNNNKIITLKVCRDAVKIRKAKQFKSNNGSKYIDFLIKYEKGCFLKHEVYK